MVNPADELRRNMLKRLRASESFSAGVGGRILEFESTEFPVAWIGVTASESGADSVDILATVHVWKRSGGGKATQLAEEAKTLLGDPPQLKTHQTVAWSLDYAETRLDEDYAAYQALIRFRGRFTGNKQRSAKIAAVASVSESP